MAATSLAARRRSSNSDLTPPRSMSINTAGGFMPPGGPPPKTPSPQLQYPTLYPIPVPNMRRQRCISCSDTGNIMDILNIEDSSSNESNKDNTELFPEVIVTKRSRSESVCGRIFEDIDTGTVKYFCRSRGHGFITPDSGDPKELFLHISDIEGEYVPRKGDKVSYRLCPIPPRYDRYQAVHVHIVDFTPGVHQKWESPETPEEIEEEKKIHSLPYDI